LDRNVKGVDRLIEEDHQNIVCQFAGSNFFPGKKCLKKYSSLN
jgi:hypothetical protein